MKQRFLLQLTALCSVFVMFALISGIAHADPQTITMTPTQATPDIAPGATYHGSFEVLNQGGTSYGFDVYTSPYHVGGEAYTPEFTPLPTAANVPSWFHLASSGGNVTAGQSDTISYTISVPQGTVAGSYYAVIFAQSHAPAINGITINERVGEIFYIEVAGPVVSSGGVYGWGTNFLQARPLTAALRLDNNGGLFFAASVNVKVRDIFGNAKFTLSTTKEVLPQTIRLIPISWSGAPILGLFKITGTVSLLNKQHSLPTKWVLIMAQPIRTALIAAVTVFILLVILQLLRRVRKRKSKKK